jgi:hypothetical protein
MTMDPRIAAASELMTRFADRTGLTSDRPPRRYLWTDAFAVCNFLGLARATGDLRHEELALRLVDQVHHELGRRRGGAWLSGLPDAEAEAHPTAGGLRIGKPLPERGPTERHDPDLEWDRDGQYFHYLTKWMHALDQVARRTGQTTFATWACELAHAAHRAFAYGPPDDRRMVWKLSVDLSRPLVSSMGHHDPLDGYVTCAELDATAGALGFRPKPSLGAATADFDHMIDRDALATSDPLGLGGLLVDASRLAQLGADPELVSGLLAATARGLRHWLGANDLRMPAHRRLAFRELGLAIGLAALPLVRKTARALGPSTSASLDELEGYAALGGEIASFWLLPEHRTSTWDEHRDINEVMLATRLAPDGFLVLEPPSRTSCVRPQGVRSPG